MAQRIVVEILVHIAAPSTSIDDLVFRSLATAYLNFEPATLAEFPENETAVSTPTLAPPTALVSPQASFHDVWAHVGSESAQTTPDKKKVQEERGSQSSWVQPPSVVADTQPGNDVDVDVASFKPATRVLSLLVYAEHHSTDSFQQYKPRIADVPGWPGNLIEIYEGSADSSALVAQSTNSILQRHCVSQITGAARSRDSESRYGTPPNGTVMESRKDESHISQTPSSPLRPVCPLPQPIPAFSLLYASRNRSSSSFWTTQLSQSESCRVTIPATQLPGKADSEPPPSKRLKPYSLTYSLEHASSDALPRGLRDPSPVPQALSPREDIAATAGHAELLTDWARLTHLAPSEPFLSSHYLEFKMPEKLERLMSDMGDRYHPIFLTQRSSMREHERGYWLLPLDDWPHGDRLSTWDFLGDYICRDQSAGWGTRACRDTSWTWVRLYGWEHVVGALYMLLYVAALGRLRSTKIAWHDGAGEALIAVQPRKEKSICWDRVRRPLETGGKACYYCGHDHDTRGLLPETGI